MADRLSVRPYNKKIFKLKKIISVIITLFCPLILFSREFGVGFIVPNYGIKLSVFNEKSIIDLSFISSNISIVSWGEKPQKVNNATLFYQKKTNIGYGNWDSIIGIGGIYSLYKQYAIYSSGGECGYSIAIGISAGSYYRYSEKFILSIEFQLGYPIKNIVIDDNPYYGIKLIPFIPKIGITYIL